MTNRKIFCKSGPSGLCGLPTDLFPPPGVQFMVTFAGETRLTSVCLARGQPTPASAFSPVRTEIAFQTFAVTPHLSHAHATTLVVFSE